MEITRLLQSDGTWKALEDDWRTQCEAAEDDLSGYATSSVEAIREFAESDLNDRWAIGLKHDDSYMAIAYAICTYQKPFAGKVLRIREVTVCPALDYGMMQENDYIDTLADLLAGAIKLSESSLKAQHIKMHLRSPADARFFRVMGHKLDNDGNFKQVETHGAWLTFTK